MLPPRVTDPNLRTRCGRTLQRTIADYDAARPELQGRSLRAACYAPFLSMDFDATGAIRLCNHSHAAIAYVSDQTPVLDVWRGPVYERFRREFADYVLDDANCPHCILQCEAGAGQHVFATEQFDRWANDERFPAYPKRLIFRLANTCNLACIMCDGETSSRIRKERDGLPPQRAAYGEAFFAEMERILPHVEHIEFYGGEPFLVREHQRIFEILQRIGSRCTIYVNTNTTAIGERARRALEQLHFVEIAVSMDAVDAAVHGAVRVGLEHAAFLQNLDYFQDLRARKGVRLTLNVTEHRKNWFQLPEVFRFAAQRRLGLHINTCIHPHNVTLYTLSDDQLRYVLAFLVDERARLVGEQADYPNLASYDFLLSLLRRELRSRGPDWTPHYENVNRQSDGLLAAPIVGVVPFDQPLRVLQEAQRMVKFLAPDTALRLLGELLGGIVDHGPYEELWRALVPQGSLSATAAWCKSHGLPLVVVLWPILQDLGAHGFHPLPALVQQALAHGGADNPMRAVHDAMGRSKG